MGRGIPFGEYRLLRRIGSGGMAEVFLAKRDGPGGFEKQLVIKRILPHLTASERFTSLFLKEARLAALIDHPNLVHVSSFGAIDGEYYLAMEYVDGLTLADLLERTGTLTPGVACRIVVDVLDALYAIHAAKNAEGEHLGLVHRDVTPRNVMITRAGAVKLLDFGIAVSAEDEVLTMGTRRYMAPEQLLGEPIDHRADLFAVGVLLWQLVTGGVPYDGLPQQVPARPDAIPEAIWGALGSSIALLPDGRPRDARAMQRPLELFVASRGIEGTRGHLAELANAVAPVAKPRMLSRLTQLGPLTRLTGSAGPRPERPWVLAGLVGAGVSLAIAAFLLLAPHEAVIEALPAGSPPSDAAEEAAPAVARGGAPVPSAPIDGEAPRVEAEAPETLGAPVEAGAPLAAPIGVAPRTPRPEETAEPRKAKRKRRRAKPPGRLTIDTTPWTVVYLGDRKLGMTPLQGVKLPSGRHTLRLENADTGLSQTIAVTIRPGKVTRVRRTL